MKKQRRCVRFYYFIQNNFIDKIIFKNQRQELENIKLNLAAGHLDIPTELETMMKIEANELIREYYDNKEGAKELFLRMKQSKDKSKTIL